MTYVGRLNALDVDITNLKAVFKNYINGYIVKPVLYTLTEKLTRFTDLLTQAAMSICIKINGKCTLIRNHRPTCISSDVENGRTVCGYACMYGGSPQ